ncbi:MAG: hypothetical protein II956_00555 [Bacteroidales bacterium]|nr:hypothetical protein [Bacteroidales bacterium]
MKLLNAHLYGKIINVFAPLTCPMHAAVGVENVGIAVETHHDTINVVTLRQNLQHGHKSVEKECTAD